MNSYHTVLLNATVFKKFIFLWHICVKCLYSFSSSRYFSNMHICKYVYKHFFIIYMCFLHTHTHKIFIQFFSVSIYVCCTHTRVQCSYNLFSSHRTGCSCIWQTTRLTSAMNYMTRTWHLTPAARDPSATSTSTFSVVILMWVCCGEG